MADTRVQLEVEDWVRLHWMSQEFGQPFHRERIRLTWGAFFDFDCVSQDRKIVAAISTSGSKTGAGKKAAAKLQKIRSDILYLLHAKAQRRIVILTEPDMF